MAAYTGTIPIAAPISPRDTRHKYPTHFDQFGKGGYQSVLSISERDSITTDRKKNGMLVYVIGEDKTYILKENNWEEVKVQITVQSLDNSVIFNDVENIKVDTDSGLGLNRNVNEAGTVILTAQKPFCEFSDSADNKISANNTDTVKFEETNTIIPKIQGNSIAFNTKTFNYKSTTPSVQHIVEHNLNTDLIIVNVYEVNDNNTKDYTVIPYTISDLNTIELTLSVAKNIMVNIIPLEPI